MEAVAVRGSCDLWTGRRPFLHAHQDDHGALAYRDSCRRGYDDAYPGVGFLRKVFYLKDLGPDLDRKFLKIRETDAKFLKRKARDAPGLFFSNQTLSRFLLLFPLLRI